MELFLHLFWTLALIEVSVQPREMAALPHGMGSWNRLITGWLGVRAGLDTVEALSQLGIDLWFPDGQNRIMFTLVIGFSQLLLAGDGHLHTVIFTQFSSYSGFRPFAAAWKRYPFLWHVTHSYIPEERIYRSSYCLLLKGCVLKSTVTWNMASVICLFSMPVTSNI